MKIYSTNYNSFIKYISGFLSNNFLGPWRLRSIGILALLLGFYLASTLTPYLLVVLKHRIFIVLLLLILVELTVRLRSSSLIQTRLFVIRSLDNFRIGITYAVVLEAFKLGS